MVLGPLGDNDPVTSRSSTRLTTTRSAGGYVLHVGQSSVDLNTQVTLTLAHEWREALPDAD